LRFDATCPESLEIVSDVQGDVIVCTYPILFHLTPPLFYAVRGGRGRGYGEVGARPFHQSTVSSSSTFVPNRSVGSGKGDRRGRARGYGEVGARPFHQTTLSSSSTFIPIVRSAAEGDGVTTKGGRDLEKGKLPFVLINWAAWKDHLSHKGRR
jgi:hypothetical protein